MAPTDASTVRFGTSGLRGLVAELTDPVCEAHVRAFLAHLRQSGAAPSEVLVGRDLRPSSARIAAACRRAIRAEGLTAVGCGVVPTPALALEAARRGAAAVMVTGSHIPFDRNGLKFYRPGGEEITKADEAGIVAALASRGRPDGAGVIRVDSGVGIRYAARAAEFFGHRTLGGLRVGLYEHSAAGRDLVRRALHDMGARVIPLGRSDSFVPIDTEAISRGLAKRIGGWVARHRLAVLVSTDGDGDRPLLADETGTVLRGDTVGALAARLLGADAVAVPVNVSTAVERSGWFERVARTRIGSPYVIEAMASLQAEGARLVAGYEANGGFLLGGAAVSPRGRLEPLLTRDALVPILAVLAAMAREGRTLSELAAGLPAGATASDRLAEIDVAACARLIAALAASEDARSALLSRLGAGATVATDTLDGLRMTLASGEIVHLRLSGNAPELRCYAEAAFPERAAALTRGVLARVERMLR